MCLRPGVFAGGRTRLATRNLCPGSLVRPKALLLDAVLAQTDYLLVHQPSEVAVAFASVTPLTAAPECLASLDLEDVAAMRAPALVSGPRPGSHHLSVASAAAADGREATRMEVAACLAAPVVVEENAAEIMRAAASELAREQRVQLEARYASEVQLTRQRSFEGGDGQNRSSRRRGSGDGSSWADLSSPSPEVKQVMEELLEVHTHKNRLVLEEPRVLTKPDECITVEEPDHEYLLSSSLASLDQTAADQVPILASTDA